MYKNSKEQYINILRQDKQLKINYKILQDKKIIKQEVSSFLLNNNEISKDAIFKLDTLQKDIDKTYLSALYEKENQSIWLTQNIDKNRYKSVALDDKYSIAIDTKDIKQYISFFQNSGLDYLVSPFSILYDHISKQLSSSSLNILLYNNIIYALILDENKELSRGYTKSLTSFENIKESNFYTDDIVGQKLYEEICFLELQQITNDIIEQYYKDIGSNENENVSFLEKINIFYSIKQLSDEQIEIMQDLVMMDVNYIPISIEQSFDNIIQKPTIANYSFLSPRVKKLTNSINLWISILIITIIIIGSIIFYKISNSNNIQPDKVKVKKIEKKATIKKENIENIIKLPNHNLINTNFLEKTLMFFDLIAYDTVLLELELKKDSSTFVCNFIIDSNSSQVMLNKLSKIYNESKIILQHKNKAIISTIISNSGYKASKIKKDNYEKLKYQKHKFITSAEFTKYLNSIAIQGSDIRYISKKQEKFLTYNYAVTSVVDTPKEFFDFISKINKKKIPLNIQYPVEFSKVKDKIEVKYNLQFHQLNKTKIK